MKAENGDATVETPDVKEEELEGENLENFKKLSEYGISKPVALELIKIYISGRPLLTYFFAHFFPSWLFLFLERH